MARKTTSPIEQLRMAIDCLPVNTRVAMLEGVRNNVIIVGAYTDDGGVCPMLAAHRNGGRTNFLSFAKAWDRFAGAKRSRRATAREVRILTTHLEASLLAEETGTFPEAMAEHRKLLEERGYRDPAGPVRAERLRARLGFRRDYARLLAQIEAEADAAAAQAEIDALIASAREHETASV